MKRQFEFTHCQDRNILYSVQVLCKFSQYYQIKLLVYGNFNNINIMLEVKCHMSVDLSILTNMQWAISQYEPEYNNIMLCMESNMTA